MNFTPIVYVILFENGEYGQTIRIREGDRISHVEIDTIRVKYPKNPNL